MAEAALKLNALDHSWRRSARPSRHVWRMTLTTYAATIRDIPVDEIKTADILTALKPLWNKAPAMAAKFRGRLEKVIDAARALGHIPEDRANVARWKGHLDHLLPKRQRLVRGHHKAMAPADLPAFMARLSETPVAAAKALMFTILTCARTSEVLHMTWDEVSFADAVWRVPASRMKMPKEHLVPLSDAALAIVGAQEAKRGRNPYVFPGKPRQPLSANVLCQVCIFLVFNGNEDALALNIFPRGACLVAAGKWAPIRNNRSEEQCFSWSDFRSRSGRLGKTVEGGVEPIVSELFRKVFSDVYLHVYRHDVTNNQIVSSVNTPGQFNEVFRKSNIETINCRGDFTVIGDSIFQIRSVNSDRFGNSKYIDVRPLNLNNGVLGRYSLPYPGFRCILRRVGSFP